MMIGSGMPRSHKSAPRPKPMLTSSFSIFVKRGNTNGVPDGKTKLGCPRGNETALMLLSEVGEDD